MEFGVVAGVVAIGFVHGVLPDHGWPIAATYALNRRHRWLYGTVAALILGVGHLVSSVALVAAYYWFDAFADVADGPWIGYAAGTLLILLGIREYRHGGHASRDHDDPGHGHDRNGHGHEYDGHARDHETSHGHALEDGTTRRDGGAGSRHDQHGHHDHHDHDGTGEDGDDDGVLERVRRLFPGGNGHAHLEEEHAERGLAALGTTALLLGFAHEEPIQILAICSGAGTDRCLELMLVYSLAVSVAIVTPTLLLIAGYERHRDRIERFTPYLPTITAVVLIGMGLGFVVGVI